MMMNPNQIKHLADLVSSLRPEWDAQGVRAALLRLPDCDPVDGAIAAVRAAGDPMNRTPGVIPMQGPHWQQITRKPVLAPLAERAAAQRAELEAARRERVEARESRERARRECRDCNDKGRLPAGGRCGHPKEARV